MSVNEGVIYVWAQQIVSITRTLCCLSRKNILCLLFISAEIKTMKKTLLAHSCLVSGHLSPRACLLRLESHWPILTSQQAAKVKGQHVYPHSHSHRHTFKLMATDSSFSRKPSGPLDLASEN